MRLLREAGSGAMMLYFVMYFMFFILFGLLMVEVAKTNGSVSIVDEAMSVSAVSVLADYDTHLLDRWGLVAFEQYAANPIGYSNDTTVKTGGYSSTNEKINSEYKNLFEHMFHDENAASSSLLANVSVNTASDKTFARGWSGATLGDPRILKAGIQEYSKQNLPLMLGKDFQLFYQEDNKNSTHHVSKDSVIGRAAAGLEQQSITDQNPMLSLVDKAYDSLTDAIKVVESVDGGTDSWLKTGDKALSAYGLRNYSLDIDRALDDYKGYLETLRNKVGEYNTAVGAYNAARDDYKYMATVEWHAVTNVIYEAGDYGPQVTAAGDKRRTYYYNTWVSYLDALPGAVAAYTISVNCGNEAPTTIARARELLTLYAPINDGDPTNNDSIFDMIYNLYWNSATIQQYYGNAMAALANAETVPSSTDTIAVQKSKWENKFLAWKDAKEVLEQTNTGQIFTFPYSNYAGNSDWPTNCNSSSTGFSTSLDETIVSTAANGSNTALHSLPYLNGILKKGFTAYMQPYQNNLDACKKAVQEAAKKAIEVIGETDGATYIIDGDKHPSIRKSICDYFTNYKKLNDKQKGVWSDYKNELNNNGYVANHLIGVSKSVVGASSGNTTPSPTVSAVGAPNPTHPLSASASTFWNDKGSSFCDDAFWNNKKPTLTGLASLEVTCLQSYARSMQRLLYFLQKLLDAYPITETQVNQVKTECNDKISNNSSDIHSLNWYKTMSHEVSETVKIKNPFTNSYEDLIMYAARGDKLSNDKRGLKVDAHVVNLHKKAWVVPATDSNYYNNCTINIESYIANMKRKLFYRDEACLQSFCEATNKLLNPGSVSSNTFNVGDARLSACIDIDFYESKTFMVKDEDGRERSIVFTTTDQTGTEKMVAQLQGSDGLDSSLETLSKMGTYDSNGKNQTLGEVLRNLRQAYKKGKDYQSCGGLINAMTALSKGYTEVITSDIQGNLKDLTADQMRKYWLGNRLITAGYGVYSTSNRFNYGAHGLSGRALSNYDFSKAETPKPSEIETRLSDEYGSFKNLNELFKGFYLNGQTNQTTDPDHNPDKFSTSVEREKTFVGAELEYLVHGSSDEWENQYYTFMLLLQMGMLRSADAVAFNPEVQARASAMSFAYPLYLTTNIFELGLRDTNYLCGGQKVDLCRESCPGIAGGNTAQLCDPADPSSDFNLFCGSSSVSADESFNRVAKEGLLYRDHCLIALLAFVPSDVIAQRVANLVQMETLNYYQETRKDSHGNKLNKYFQLGETYTFIEAKANVGVQPVIPGSWSLARGLALNQLFSYDRTVYRGY